MPKSVDSRRADPPSEDYEAIAEAVMESPRGRWFLSEFAKRQRSRETAVIIDSLHRLEAATADLYKLTTNQDEIGKRIMRALERQSTSAAEGISATPTTGGERLNKQHLAYFRQDEDIFEPSAERPETPKLVPSPAPETPRQRVAATEPRERNGAKLVIRRVSEVAPGTSAMPTATTPEEAVPTPATAPGASPDDQSASQVAAQSANEAQAKKRIVIIRHAAGEAMDVPLQNELAAAS